MREFGVKLSVIAAPLREASLAAKRGFGVGTSRLSLRSNATFLGIPCVSPPPGRIERLFGSKSCSPSGVAYMCSPDLGFYRVDRASSASNSKVCGFVILFMRTFRNSL